MCHDMGQFRIVQTLIFIRTSQHSALQLQHMTFKHDTTMAGLLAIIATASLHDALGVAGGTQGVSGLGCMRCQCTPKASNDLQGMQSGRVDEHAVAGAGPWRTCADVLTILFPPPFAKMAGTPGTPVTE
jgi:hypothetical protein